MTLKIGTVPYAAPEIHLRSSPDPDRHTEAYSTKPTDVWSLGLILLECYDRTHRTKHKDEQWNYHGTAVERASSFSGKPDVFSRLISGTIKIDPTDRLTAADCRRICRESTSTNSSSDVSSTSSDATVVDAVTGPSL